MNEIMVQTLEKGVASWSQEIVCSIGGGGSHHCRGQLPSPIDTLTYLGQMNFIEGRGSAEMRIGKLFSLLLYHVSVLL